MAEPKSFPALTFLLEQEMALPRFDPIVARDARAELEKARELLADMSTIQEVASGERQVTDDDTKGMEWIDGFAQRAIAACRERS
jgi:hypothetical protein